MGDDAEGPCSGKPGDVREGPNVMGDMVRADAGPDAGEGAVRGVSLVMEARPCAGEVVCEKQDQKVC